MERKIIIQTSGMNVWGNQICMTELNKLPIKMEEEISIPSICQGTMYASSKEKEILYFDSTAYNKYDPQKNYYLKLYDTKKKFFKNTDLVKLSDTEFCSGTFIGSNAICYCHYNNLLHNYELSRLVFSKKNLEEQNDDLKNTLAIDQYAVRSMLYDMNVMVLYTGNINGTFRQINLFSKDQKEIECKSTIYSLRFMDDNKKTIFGTLDGKIITVDLEKMISENISESKSSVYSVYHDDTNHLIISGDMNGVLNFIDAKSKKKAHDSFSTNYQIGSIYGSSIIYLPDQYQLIVGNYDAPSSYCSRLVFFDLRKFTILGSNNLKDYMNGKLLSLDLM